MNLYQLGEVRWDESQAIYHSLAQIGQEGLVICRPSGRCVCLGLHDDLLQEVNTKYCQDNSIPVIRRDIGGGMVLLSEGQVFFQLILRGDNPLLAGQREAFFIQFLEPVIKTLADFSIKASIKLPADIVVNGKKISGNGAGDINGFSVYTGNILLTFDRLEMANVLNVPSSPFREQIRLSMENHLTTMSEELGYLPDYESVEARLVHHFACWLNLKPGMYTQDLKSTVNKMAKYLTSDDFLSLPGKQSKVRQVKINEGTYVRLHPFPQCIKATAVDENACENRTNGLCTGYAILMIKNNRIVGFESHGLPCLEQYNLHLLATSLHGSLWNEQAVAVALGHWFGPEESSINDALRDALTAWILAK